MIDVDTVTRLGPRRSRKRRIHAEFPRRQREPGARRNDAGKHGTALDKLVQAGFTKIPCVGRAALGYDVAMPEFASFDHPVATFRLALTDAALQQSRFSSAAARP